MNIFRKLFGRGNRQAPPSDAGRQSKRCQQLLHDAVELFGQERFKEAHVILEEAAELDPSSAPVQFTLGTTYLRITGEYGRDEDAARPWAAKSRDAFEKAIHLANQYGGLNENQLTKARDVVAGFDRLAVKEPASRSVSQPASKRGAATGAGATCAKCGQVIQSEFSPHTQSLDPFADAVRLVGAVLTTLGYTCRDCGATVCKGCMPMGTGAALCPKCGSTKTRLGF